MKIKTESIKTEVFCVDFTHKAGYVIRLPCLYVCCHHEIVKAISISHFSLAKDPRGC